MSVRLRRLPLIVYCLVTTALALNSSPAQTASPTPQDAAAKKQKSAEYINIGDNIRGFSMRYGNPTINTDGKTLNAFPGGGWYVLPVRADGDFRIEFDVFNDSDDGDSHLLLVDDATNAGIDVRNSPQGTDTPTINIFAAKNLAAYDDFYFPKTTLATANATAFPNRAWTHVIITKIGNKLTDNCGGQVITADLGNVFFPAKAHIGLGYYATNFQGGKGTMNYRNIRISDADAPPGVPDLIATWAGIPIIFAVPARQESKK